MSGGLLKRNRRSEKLRGRELSWPAVSGWCRPLAVVGRNRDAEKLFKKLWRLRNEVGLLSEEYDPRARGLTGNFPILPW